MFVDEKIFKSLESHNMGVAEFLSRPIQIEHADYKAENSSSEKTLREYFFNCIGDFKAWVDEPRRYPKFFSEGGVILYSEL